MRTTKMKPGFRKLVRTLRERRESCEYCDGTGEVEMDNNGPIGPCPVCSPPGRREVSAQKDKWQELETRLSGVFGFAKAKAGGHELSIKKALDSERLVVQVFVDGWIKGEWVTAEDGRPVHPEARFWRPMRCRVYPLKKHSVLKKVFGKKRADEMTALRVIGFTPHWNSPRALVRHLRRHFPDLELMGEIEAAR
jgi:hypothetical protein